MALLVSAIGITVIVFGVIFIAQSGSARQQVADGIAPVTLDKLNATYDTVSEKQKAVMAAEEPNIQAGKAAPSATYNYLTVQKVGLGLAKTNRGLADLIQTMGIIDVIMGVGLLVGGFLLMKKTSAPASGKP
jgi:hypothetical protein